MARSLPELNIFESPKCVYCERFNKHELPLFQNELIDSQAQPLIKINIYSMTGPKGWSPPLPPHLKSIVIQNYPTLMLIPPDLKREYTSDDFYSSQVSKSNASYFVTAVDGNREHKLAWAKRKLGQLGVTYEAAQPPNKTVLDRQILPYYPQKYGLQ